MGDDRADEPAQYPLARRGRDFDDVAGHQLHVRRLLLLNRVEVYDENVFGDAAGLLALDAYLVALRVVERAARHRERGGERDALLERDVLRLVDVPNDERLRRVGEAYHVAGAHVRVRLLAAHAHLLPLVGGRGHRHLRARVGAVADAVLRVDDLYAAVRSLGGAARVEREQFGQSYRPTHLEAARRLDRADDRDELRAVFLDVDDDAQRLVLVLQVTRLER